MDYYEVLGVRRTARLEEIELAFKGRRAQYHPDRYSASDSDTVQWATQQMQAVNAAYAVLSDPHRRASYDRQDEPSPEAAVEPERNRPLAQISLRQWLAERLPSSVDLGRIYLAPHIPIKKLSAALANYGQDLRSQDVVALLDATVFGGCKEGVMLTEKALLIKEFATPRYEFAWDGIKQLQVSGTALFVEGRKVSDCHMVEETAMAVFFGNVEAFVSALQESQASHDHRDPRKDSAKKQQTDNSKASAQGAFRSGQGMEAGDSSPKTPSNAQLFDLAKAKLVEVCKVLETAEKSNDREIVDRENAVRYFAYLKERSTDPDDAPIVIHELKMIVQIGEQILGIDRVNLSSQVDELAEEDKHDSQLVAELKFVLRACLDGIRSHLRKAEVDWFFKG